MSSRPLTPEDKILDLQMRNHELSCAITELQEKIVDLSEEAERLKPYKTYYQMHYSMAHGKPLDLAPPRHTLPDGIHVGSNNE